MEVQNDLEIITYDRYLCRPIFWYLVSTVVTVFGGVVLSAVGLRIPDILTVVLRYGISAIFILLAISKINNNKKLLLILIEAFFGISYFLVYINGYSSNQMFTTYLISTLVICIPFGVIVSSIKDYTVLYETFKKASWINSPILIVYLIITIATSTYEMPATYQLLFCVIFHVNETFEKNESKHKFFLILYIILEAMLMILRGARGPIVCFAVYLGLKIILEAMWSTKWKVMALFSCVLLIIATFNFDSIVLAFGNTFTKFGLSSRFVNQLMSGEFFNDSGRGTILDHAKQYINARPLIGYGVSSDFTLLGQYVHNLYYELVFDFGYILGIVGFLIIICKVIRILFMRKSIEKDILVALLAPGFVMLFFSGTYLQNIYFFMLLGISITGLTRRNIRIGRIYL